MVVYHSFVVLCSVRRSSSLQITSLGKGTAGNYVSRDKRNNLKLTDWFTEAGSEEEKLTRRCRRNIQVLPIDSPEKYRLSLATTKSLSPPTLSHSLSKLKNLPRPANTSRTSCGSRSKLCGSRSGSVVTSYWSSVVGGNLWECESHYLSEN